MMASRKFFHQAFGLLLSTVILSGMHTRSSFAQAVNPTLRTEGPLDRIELLLQHWSIAQAKSRMESLLLDQPDQPDVQRMAAWVKHHLGEHIQAKSLFDQASGRLESRGVWAGRYALVSAAADLSRSWRRAASDDGKVVIQYTAGIDEIMLPYLIDTIARTLKVVGWDLGFVPDHPILVEILENESALSKLTGLSVDQIRTSGTIAVCKYGRLMIISPRATLKGYGWLDTISHELVHLIISEKTQNRTPVWLHEALARYEERRWRSDEPLYRKSIYPLDENLLAQALEDDSWIRFERFSTSIAMLDSEQEAALAFAELFMVAYFLHSLKDFDGLKALLDGLAGGKTAFDSIQEVYGIAKDEFFKTWLRWMDDKGLNKLRGDPDLARIRRNSKHDAGRSKKHGDAEVALRDHVYLGELLRGRGRHRASVAEFQKAADLAGSDHAAFWMISNKLGLAFSEIGKTDEALSAFRRGLAMKPDDMEAHLHICGLMQKTEPFRAWLHCREAFRVNPLDPRVHASSHRAAEILLKKNNQRENWREHIKRHRKAFRLLSSRGVEKPPGSAEKQAEKKGASIKILTKPWARVWIDYKDTGMTTPLYNLELSPGVHVIGLVADCQKHPEVVRIRLSEGETELIERKLCSGGP